MLNGPAFTDRTGHGQTTFPKFPRFAVAGPTATARLALMTAVGCAAATISDNRTICVQFLDGYAAQGGGGGNASPPPLFFSFFFKSDFVTVLYDAYPFSHRLKSQPCWTGMSLSWRGGGGGGGRGEG